VRRLAIVSGLVGLLGLPACGYDAATDACYSVLDVYGTRLVECGVFPTVEQAEAAILETWSAEAGAPVDCDRTPVGVRDERELYDECLPALMTLPCERVHEAPSSCDAQIVYRR